MIRVISSVIRVEYIPIARLPLFESNVPVLLYVTVI